MYTLEVENKNGSKFKLTQKESRYQIIGIQGLNPPSADIYTSVVANMDGEKFKSSRLQMRNIVLTIKVNGNIEENRINLYTYFRTGQWCKLYYTNDTRAVYCEGYCETIECNLFTMNQQMQISIVCPTPYLISLTELYSDISKTFGNFTFPFSIPEEGIIFGGYDENREVTVVNYGESDTGLIITLTATADTITNPQIFEVGTSNFMKLNTTLNSGDVVIINTNVSKKSIKKISNGVESNIINSLDSTSHWLQLKVGATNFTYSTVNNQGDLKVEFTYNSLFMGV